jgi:hypothetical protein
MDSNEFKWIKQAGLESNGQHQEKTYYETSYEPGKQRRIEEF